MKEEHERSSIQYEICMSSFKQQVSYKHNLLVKLSEDMSLKISSNDYKKKQGTSEVVQLCRKNIEQIQHIFLDLHAYFVDVKLQFIYELAVQIFKTLVLGYKLLSERFVALLKNRKKKDDEISEQNFQRNTEKLILEAKQKNFTEVQYYDCLIKTIQLDEYRLSEKSRQAQKRFYIDKATIDRVNASDAVHHLQSLKRQMDRIIMYSVKFANDQTRIREKENTKNLKELTNPDIIQDEYCKNIAVHTQQIFKNKMSSIAKKFYETTRQKYRQEFIRQAIENKPLQFHRETQTYELQLKPKQQLQKATEIQMLKRVNGNLTKELQDMNQKIIKLEVQKNEIQNKVKYTVDLLNKKMLEFHKSKSEFQFQLGKKDQMISSLNRKVSQDSNRKINDGSSCKDQTVVSPENNLQDHQDSLGESFLENQNYDDDLALKLRFNANKSHHTSFFYEKQFKATKQQNSHLRKSLSIMLDALKEQKLILEYPINDLNNDLRLGKLISKIEAISIQLLNKVRQIRLKDQSKVDDRPGKKRTLIKSQIAIAQSDKKKQGEKKFISAQTQTTQCYKVQSIYSSMNHTTRENNAVEDKKKVILQAGNKLETLKKQLMNKVNLGKRNHGTVRLNRQKQNLVMIQTNNNSNKSSCFNLAGGQDMNNSKRISKVKPSFNRKDVSFEQFKFSLIENKSQYADKKIPISSKKSILNPNFKTPIYKDKRRSNKSHDYRHVYVESEDHEQNLGAQAHGCLNQVKKIIQTIESKTNEDKKEIYLRQFIHMLIAELSKIKGSQAVDELFVVKTPSSTQQNHHHTLSCS